MEMDDAFLNEICRVKSSGSTLSSLLNSGLAIADCSASAETLEVLKQSISFGCCIVLANKKPLTGKIEDYEKLISNFRQIRFESTVGAGLPVIASVTRVLSSGDAIYCIIGSLSDPRDDLSGMDVARKVDSLYPDEMGPKSMSIDDFINRGLRQLDKDVGEKVEMAASKGNVLRYVCNIEGSRWKYTADATRNHHW
ncbi:Bifunctional aspartokinase/homoserine dehydrogenase 1, chloroplastic [Apostasia shenzhenica]|uniref:homoserine dehydrogenase n=1 Tax=Apostasia shenzhenica TaxID=1088818 RepID=A0A2I0A8E5_9ASPA|nr:Bifunctional aspartokinase/homoserine dehydrogenase 1, chloroplastic [Apostasia shenzhenica]